MKPAASESNRESIEDHIRAARDFLRTAGIEADATRSWVRDLCGEQIINGPRSISKVAGRGRAVRFAPPDYRGLIEIMRLRAEGAIHRSTWLTWLWLKGREYDLSAVRDALAADLRRNLHEVRRQFAPTGRDTEPFTVKFRRNIAPRETNSPLPDLGPFFEPLAALMFRPAEAKDVLVDLNAVVSFASETLGIPADQMREAINAAIAAPKADDSAIKDFVNALPDGEFSILARTIAQATSSVEMPHIAGMIDDGFGNSTIERALQRATDDELLRTRALVRAVRTGQVEAFVRNARETVAPDEDIALKYLGDWARIQRMLLRGNPVLSASIFCTYLAADGPPIPIEFRKRLNVDALLQALQR